MGQVYANATARKRVTGLIFFVLPYSSGAQLRELKLALTEWTKIKALYAVCLCARQDKSARGPELKYKNQDYVNRRSTAKQKALVGQNTISGSY